jgi:hypothetical protein
MPNVVYPGFENLSLIGLDQQVGSLYVRREDPHVESG